MRYYVLLVFLIGCVEVPVDGTSVASTQAELNVQYVRAPGGLVHPSCVYRVPSGSSIQDRDGETVVNGQDGFHMVTPPCDAPPPPVPSQAALLPGGTLGSGYAAIGWATAPRNTANPGNDWYRAFSSGWVVPDEPSVHDSQTLIYFFNGLEPTGGASIVQPVLQFGSSPSGGGEYWSVASYYVTSGGNVITTTAEPVNVGDTLLGEGETYSCTASGDCDWRISIRTDDYAVNQVLVTDADNYVYDVGMVGAMEVYGFTACDHLPASGAIAFYNTHLYEPGAGGGLVDVRPTVAPAIDTTGTPQCNYSMSTFDRGVTIRWTP
jgi:hypothetical protein